MWTDEKLQKAVRTLERHTRLDPALQELNISYDAIQAAFKRYGLDTPTSYLRHPDSKEDVDDRPSDPSSRLLPSDDLQTIIVANDFHIPFHCENGVEAWLDFCEDLQPDEIVINGDFLDCHSISSFPKEPGDPLLQDEIDQGKEILYDLRSRCQDAKIYYLEGNHEERLHRLMKEKEGLYQLEAISLQNLLDMEELDIIYRPYMEAVQLNELTVVHGDKSRKHSAYTAKAMIVDKGYRSVIIGHTHRLGWFTQDGYEGRKRALENGGLFDKRMIDYNKDPINWQNGFAVVYQQPDKEFLQINPVEMNDLGQFVWKGEIYG